MIAVDPLEFAARLTWGLDVDAEAGEAPARFDRHLFCGADGLFPARLDGWERTVVSDELARAETVAWYWNGARPAPVSIAACHRGGHATRKVRPDFIFFSRLDDGTIAADIVHPGGIRKGDSHVAADCLKGLAAAWPAAFRRVEVFVEIDRKVWVHDLIEDIPQVCSPSGK